MTNANASWFHDEIVVDKERVLLFGRETALYCIGSSSTITRCDEIEKTRAMALQRSPKSAQFDDSLDLTCKPAGRRGDAGAPSSFKSLSAKAPSQDEGQPYQPQP